MIFSGSLTRRTLSTLMLTTGLLVSQASTAITPDEAKNLVNTLSKIQSVSYQTVNAYYQFSNNPGDKELHMMIKSSSEELKNMVQTLSEQPGAADMAGEISTLQAIWEDYSKLLKTNVSDIIKQGYPDIRLVTELDAANLTQVKGARIAIEQAREYSKLQPDVVLDAIRESRILLLSMMTRYSARSASTVSQVFQGGDGELSVEEQSAKFAANLDMLSKELVSQPEAAKALDAIRSKWNFINSSLVNFTENNVPFVVNLYSLKMVNLLDELEGMR
ncbi:MAG: hypothetical protein IPM37_18180 [Hahellaceae bacterium]|jgi:DNA-binding transcriptional regulator GbsR (MarR family)|nr:hypothetical protein [Hahellaceae bacterium]